MSGNTEGRIAAALIIGAILLLCGFSFFVGYTVNVQIKYIDGVNDCLHYYEELCPSQEFKKEDFFSDHGLEDYVNQSRT